MISLFVLVSNVVVQSVLIVSVNMTMGEFAVYIFQSDVSGSYSDCLKMICGGED